VLVTVLATAFAKLFALVRIGRLMRVGLRDVLPWRALAVAAAATLLPVAPALVVKAHLTLRPLAVAAVTSTVYALLYGGVVGAAWLLSRAGAWPAVRLQGSAEGQ
jgi:hypothetical protein